MHQHRAFEDLLDRHSLLPQLLQRVEVERRVEVVFDSEEHLGEHLLDVGIRLDEDVSADRHLLGLNRLDAAELLAEVPVLSEQRGGIGDDSLHGGGFQQERFDDDFRKLGADEAGEIPGVAVAL